MKTKPKILIGLAVAVAGFPLLGLLLSLCGFLKPFNVPTGGMNPAVSPGDHIFMEGFSFLARKPRRGDVAIFKTDGISHAAVPPGQYFIQRVVGEPGDQLRLADGKLFVNGTNVVLENVAGEIHYEPFGLLEKTNETVSVPAGHYFVMGDNSKNSLDSRYWGYLPTGNIKGRAWRCYWPPSRAGAVK